MKVLQAMIIISLFLAGCATDGEPQYRNVSSPDGGAPPGNNVMGDGDSDVCPAACPAGEQGDPGVPGVDGLNGSSCSVEQNGSSATVVCSDGTTATIDGGVDGEGTVG